MFPFNSSQGAAIDPLKAQIGLSLKNASVGTCPNQKFEVEGFEKICELGYVDRRTLPEMIECDRIMLQKSNPSWASDMFACVDRDRERLRRFLPWVGLTRSVEDSENYIKSTEKEWKNCDLFDFGLFEKNSGQYMGNFGVHNINWIHCRCELGYWIASPFEGKGYISEAVRHIEIILFEMGFHRIEIRCDSRNLRSANVPKRAGYHLDGVLREDHFEQGQFYDGLIFSKLKNDK